MDDLEFRRRCIADPFDRDKAFRRRTRQSADHAHLVEHQTRFDKRLRAVMLDIKVPEDLQARIQLRHSLQQRQITWRFYRSSLALAASLIITTGVISLLFSPRESLQEAILAHVHDELNHLVEQKPVNDDQIRRLLGSAGGRLEGDFGRVSYAGSCQIRHHKGVHLVLQGQLGPVTVLLMPGEQLSERDAIGDARFQGIMLPTPNGSMAILGESGEPLRRIEHRVLSSIEWKRDRL